MTRSRNLYSLMNMEYEELLFSLGTFLLNWSLLLGRLFSSWDNYIINSTNGRWLGWWLFIFSNILLPGEGLGRRSYIFHQKGIRAYYFINLPKEAMGLIFCPSDQRSRTCGEVILSSFIRPP